MCVYPKMMRMHVIRLREAEEVGTDFPLSGVVEKKEYLIAGSINYTSGNLF